MIPKMLPRKWGDQGHGLGEPAPALEPPRNGDNAKNMGNAVVLENHPLREEILAWQRVGASQIMLGSAIPSPGRSIRSIMSVPPKSLTDEEKSAILGGNAARLFGMNG